MQKPWRRVIKPPAPYCATSCFSTKTIVISLCDKYTLLFEKSQTSVKNTVMFCLSITACILALAKTGDNQATYQVVNTQPLLFLESPPRDLQQRSPARSTINRLRNNGSGNLNLPSPPVTVTESLPSQQLFIPHRDLNSPNYRSFIKSSDVDRFSNIQDVQNTDDANDNIYLKKPPLVITNGSPKNQEQRTQYGTEESPRKENRPDVSSANFNNNYKNDKQTQSPVIYIEESQTIQNQPFLQRTEGPQTNQKISNDNKTNVHDMDVNIKNDKVNFEGDKPTQTTTRQPSITSKPSDLQLVNGTDIVNVTFGQRASFDGDKCPTGHIRVNGSTQCIPTD